MNCMLGFPIYSDDSVSYTPSFSGGSWQAGLPLTNLKNRQPSKVARSTNDATASTRFEVDLGVARAVRVLALVGTNISPAATVRWRASNSAGSFGTPIYDSTALAVSFAAVSAEDRDGIDFSIVHVPAAAQTARYWLIEIDDQLNPDGYVEIGRLIIAAGYQPTYNMSYGARVKVENDTERAVTDGGAAQYDVRPNYRIATFALDDLSQTEAFANAWKIQRLAAKHRQLFFVFDPADTTLMHERAFLGVLRELSGLEFVAHDAHSAGFAIVEDL